MKDERKYHEIQDEKQDSKERQAREDEEDLTEEEKTKAKKQGLVEHYDGVSGSLIDILSENPHFHPDKRLSPEEMIALDIVHRVKMGQDEQGAPASSRTRRLLLNQALAALQPVLSVALDPRLKESLLSSYKKVQQGVKELRQELQTAKLMEMHSGKGTLKAAKPKSPQEEQAEITEQANLAWELVQLWKKRKKRRFSHNLDANPVGNVLAAIVEKATAIAEAAAVAKRAGEKLDKERDSERRNALRSEWTDAAVGLVDAVQQFLDMCQPAPAGQSSIASYPNTLLPRFQATAARFGGLTTLEEALQAGAALLEAAIQCEDEQDEIVETEAKR